MRWSEWSKKVGANSSLSPISITIELLRTCSESARNSSRQIRSNFWGGNVKESRRQELTAPFQMRGRFNLLRACSLIWHTLWLQRTCLELSSRQARFNRAADKFIPPSFDKFNDNSIKKVCEKFNHETTSGKVLFFRDFSVLTNCILPENHYSGLFSWYFPLQIQVPGSGGQISKVIQTPKTYIRLFISMSWVEWCNIFRI